MLHSHPNLTIKTHTNPTIKLHIIKSTLKLTKIKIKNVLSKSLIQTKKFNLKTIIKKKKNIIQKNKILNFYETHQPINNINNINLLKN